MKAAPPHPGESEASSTAPPARVSALDIFLAFTQIALSGFGGVHFWARYVLVERRHWLTDREYVELLAMGQMLPGPNVLNLGLMLGHRFAGVPGAFACIAGFIGWPFLVVIGIAMLYARIEHLPVVQQGLAGMSAAAVGLLIANGLKLASVLPRRWQPWLFAALAFASVGLMHWPLIAVLAVLAPLAVGVAWWEKR
jgi:chromate transporter